MKLGKVATVLAPFAVVVALWWKNLRLRLENLNYVFGLVSSLPLLRSSLAEEGRRYYTASSDVGSQSPLAGIMLKRRGGRSIYHSSYRRRGFSNFQNKKTEKMKSVILLAVVFFLGSLSEGNVSFRHTASGR